MTTEDRTPAGEELLPVERVGNLSIKPVESRWLVRPIWGRAAVGFVFGFAKVYKSWCCLDVATSVASGTRCLGEFPVEDPGPVLIYLAEDALEDVRSRVASICARRGVDIRNLDLHVITAPALRLDRSEYQKRLQRTVESIRPRLLVLDPLVRLHSLNENDVGEISQLLGYLRELQRAHDMAVMVVHHARKRGAAQAGQTLRGSSDFFAWTDSTVCLTREGARRVVMEVEHRSTRSPDPIRLELQSRDDGADAYLRVLDRTAATPPSSPLSIEKKLLEILGTSEVPRTNRDLRESLQVQNSRLSQVLTDLGDQGLIERKGRAGWVLRSPESREPSEQSLLPFSEIS